MSARRAKRVLLIGWDAADWKFLRPLLEAGKMPRLQELIDRGASGRIATLRPVLSPLLWNSIATGKHGDQHQVLGFVEPRLDGQGLRPVASTSRRAKALWNILSQSGQRAVVVNWFASHPAEHIHGCVVSNRYAEMAPGPHPLEPSLAYPSELLPILEECRVRPNTLTDAQMAPFFPVQPPHEDDPRLQGIALQLARCASVHHAATHLAETAEWDFLAVYYDMIDHVGHGFMPYAPPRMEHISEEDFAIYGQVMESTYLWHDLLLGRWLELAGDDTTVMVLSDHGFFSGKSRPRAGRGRLSSERASGVEMNPLSWHHPQGVLVLAGPGIRSDVLVHGSSLLDIAPTILTLLGLPVAKDMAGTPLLAAFSDSTPPERIASYEPPHPADGVWRDVLPDESDPWAAREALRQLAELGYVDLAGDDVAAQMALAVRERDSHLAQIYASTGRQGEALDALRRLIAAAPERPEPRCREALCLMALNRPAEAEAVARAVLAEHPDIALAHLALGQALLLQNHADEAYEILDRVRAAEAEMPLVHLQLGMVYLRQHRWTEAEEIFRKWLEHDPDSAEAHDGLGVALREQGRVDDAIHEHMQAVSLQHDRAQTHVNLGIALGVRRQWDWAIRAFEVAADLAPEEPFPHRCLTRLFFSVKKDREKALAHARKMLELRAAMRSRNRMPAFSTGA